MQAWLNFIVIVALAAMVGVSVTFNQMATERADRYAYIEAHPDIDQEVAGALVKGNIATGMTPEQVSLSWGQPLKVLLMADRADVELWAYQKAMVLFNEGSVEEWVEARSKFDNGIDLVRRFDFVMSNEMEDRTASLIRKGQIADGMSPDQVEASWGEPSEVLPIFSDTLGEFTLWVYERGDRGEVTITFQEGEVIRVSQFSNVTKDKDPIDQAPSDDS
jgi:hypothetical protein